MCCPISFCVRVLLRLRRLQTCWLALSPPSSPLTSTSRCDARPPCSACCLFTPIQGIHLRGHSSNKFTQQPPLSRDLSILSPLTCSFSLHASTSLPTPLLVFCISLSVFFQFCFSPSLFPSLVPVCRLSFCFFSFQTGAAAERSPSFTRNSGAAEL